MLHSLAGDRIDAPRLTRDAPVHQLKLRFEPGRLYVDRQDPPWKVVRAFGPLVHLHNVSGGVLSGDRLALDVDVAPGAAAQITTTGASRLYRHRAGAEDSEQHTTITVRENGLLEYLPDPLIPFASSRHTQRTSISLGRNATLFWWETLTPGRLAAGECFAFEHLRISTSITAGGSPILLENFSLEPHNRALATVARMGAHTYLASFYAASPGRPSSFWLDLESKLMEVASHQTSSVWGVSTLAADGVIARGLSTSGRDLPRTLIELWRAAKQFITGQEAVPPRKVQ